LEKKEGRESGGYERGWDTGSEGRGEGGRGWGGEREGCRGARLHRLKFHNSCLQVRREVVEPDVLRFLASARATDRDRGTAGSRDSDSDRD